MSAIVIELSGEKAVLEALDPRTASRAVAAGMDKGAALVVGRITRERYTGQGPFPVSDHRLGVKTNRLRSSLRWTKAKVNADGSVSGAIGSNVRYAGVHEYGFQGTVDVESFERAVSASQFSTKDKQVNLSKIKGKKARKEALGRETVRAHRRVMNIPARAPLMTGLAEHAGIFTAAIGDALVAAWDKQRGGANS